MYNLIKKTQERKTIFGHRASDVIGMFILLIPIAISILWSARGGFLNLITYEICPQLGSAGIACVFYLALIIRTDLFKKDTVGDTIYSIIRTVLNIWVLASMFEICIPNCKLFDKVALFTIAFAWLGMKTIAGYGWIIFIVSGTNNIINISTNMGWIGAVYVIAIALSLFLQVYSLSSIREIWEDFNNKTVKHRTVIAEDIGMAGENAKKSIKKTAVQIKNIIDE